LQTVDFRCFDYKVFEINRLRVIRAVDFLFTPEGYRI